MHVLGLWRAATIATDRSITAMSSPRKRGNDRQPEARLHPCITLALLSVSSQSFCKVKLRNYTATFHCGKQTLRLTYTDNAHQRSTNMTPKTINKKLVTSSKDSPDHVFLRKSPSVPSPTGTDCGRDTLYQIDIVVSPHYVSMRNEHEDLVSDEVVKELTKLFGGVSLDRSANPKKQVTKKEFKIEETKSSSFDAEEKSTVGRFDDTVFSKKAKGEVKVKRSFRLTDDTKKT